MGRGRNKKKKKGKNKKKQSCKQLSHVETKRPSLNIKYRDAASASAPAASSSTKNSGILNAPVPRTADEFLQMSMPLIPGLLDMVAQLRKLHFKHTSLDKTFHGLLDTLKLHLLDKSNSRAEITDCTNLWSFLLQAKDGIASKHEDLKRQQKLMHSIAMRIQDSTRQQVKLEQVERFGRQMKTCQHDATVFNVATTLFTRTEAYRQLLYLRETEFITNSFGERVKRLKPEEINDDFDSVLAEEREWSRQQREKKHAATNGAKSSSATAAKDYF